MTVFTAKRAARAGFAASAAVAMMTMAALPASAYTLNADGTGFVGKGEVQLALGLNNAGVQALGNPSFTYSSTTVQETSWVCVNERNGNEQERARTTTTKTEGIVSSIARVKNQITGYNLNGFSGSTTTVGSTEGPPIESCPNANSTYALGSTVVGEPTVVSGGLYVNGVLLP
jgi:hypothetical protein